MEFKYLDINPDDKRKVFFCSSEFLWQLNRSAGVLVGRMELQEGTTIRFVESGLFPVVKGDGEVIHGIMMAERLEQIDPAFFNPRTDTEFQKRDLWTFKL